MLYTEKKELKIYPSVTIMRFGGDDTPNFYPRLARYTTIAERQFLQAVSNNSLVGGASVTGAVYAIFSSVVNFLMNGHSVSFGDLMTLRPVVKSYWQEFQSMGALFTPEEWEAWEPWCYYMFNAKDIRGTSLAVTWGADVRPLCDRENYTFTPVPFNIYADPEKED